MTVTGVEVIGQTARIMLSANDSRLVAEVTTLAVNELGLVAGAPVWASVKATEIDCYPR
ncbi:TOBE domain-containing protein [Branchiibius cervicis]|uniref:TOBE domain-containing protein n=1 Tax=Branchiibius cervicis TaxID=908252 RepID=A0ABW2AVR7_9MICO